MDGGDERSAELAFVEGADESGIVADSREDDGVGGGEGFRCIGALWVCAEAAKGALDGGDVASAVVKEEKIHKRPFVLGRTRARRLSRETAKRNARAKTLNMASTWWCEERP